MTLAKRIINAVNHKNKEMLRTELSNLTSYDLLVFLGSGYKFLIPDLLKIMEMPDARPTESTDPVLHPEPVAEDRNESDRAVSVGSGSS